MLTCRINSRSQGLTVQISGSMDEGSDQALNPLLPKLKRAHVGLDVSGVSAANSVGYRHWTRFLQTLSTESTFDLIDCPPIMLEYAALLPALSFASMIRSVLVPYQCESCSKSASISYEVDAFEGEDEFPIAVCASCAGVSRAEVPFGESIGLLRKPAG